MKSLSRIPAALAALILFLFVAGTVYAQGLDWNRLLKQALPEADRFSQVPQTVRYTPQKLTLAMFPAYKGDTQVGIVYYAAPDGYSGRIHTLTALDMEGTVKNVNIFSHTETPAYVVPLDNKSFQRQFIGVTLLDKLSLLIGKRAEKKGDVEAISGATDTSKPIAFAVSEARKLFAEMYPLQ